MNIPWLDVRSQHQPLREEILAAWARLLDAAAFVGGQEVLDFEQEFATACQAAHCCAVSSGTDALRLAFLALGLEPGDEVITVPNTFIATTEAITQAGGRVVFVDMDPDTYTIDPRRVQEAITPRTRGIVPVHLYGLPADMDPLVTLARENNLWVVEDAAQAQLAEYKGCRAGSLADAAAFSFYPGKNLGACGEAGAVVTSNAELDARMRCLRDHGQAKKYYHQYEGYNNRCDALQAAALRIKLRHLPRWNEDRRALADRYHEQLADVSALKLPAVPSYALPVWHLFVIQVDHRDTVQQQLAEAGIGTGLHYPLPLHLQQAYAYLRHSAGDFPRTEAMAERLLTLPLYPSLAPATVDRICETLRTVLATTDRHAATPLSGEAECSPG